MGQLGNFVPHTNFQNTNYTRCVQSVPINWATRNATTEIKTVRQLSDKRVNFTSMDQTQGL